MKKKEEIFDFGDEKESFNKKLKIVPRKKQTNRENSSKEKLMSDEEMNVYKITKELERVRIEEKEPGDYIYMIDGVPVKTRHRKN